MRGLTGLTLLLAGGLAGVYSYLPNPVDRDDALRAMSAYWGPQSKSSTGATDQNLVVADPQRRIYSPQAPLFQPPAPQAPVSAPSGTAAATDRPAKSPVKTVRDADTAASPAASFAASPARTVTEVIGTEPARLAVAPQSPVADPSRRIASIKVDQDDARRDLTRSLQTELKRVGCYSGEITGSWGATSKQAMKAFTERVNASLPVEEPDYILLTMVQGHGANACGQNCPTDQILNSEGRCLPRAIVAQAKKKADQKAAAAGRGDTSAPSPEKKSEGLKRLATPKVEPFKAEETRSPTKVADAAARAAGAQKNPAVGQNWQTTTVATAAVVGAAAAIATVPATKVIEGSVATAAAPTPLPGLLQGPLPGRMAIGGPVPPPVQVQRDPTGADAGPTPAQPAAQSPAQSSDREDQDAEPKTAIKPRPKPNKVVRNEQPEPKRLSPPYRVGATSAPKPVAVPSAARFRARQHDYFATVHRAAN